jgi:HSP20 family protein
MEVVKNMEQQNGGAQAAQTQTKTQPHAQPRQERVRAFAPPVDVFEGEEAILVLVDVPGVTQEEVTLRLEKDELSLQARRPDPAGRGAGIEYRRVFAVPPDVDGEAVTADLSRGVLKLTLPRKASAKPRQIQVRGG